MADEESARTRRRILVVLLVVGLALLGAGVGSFFLDGDDGQPGILTPTPDADESVNVSLETGSDTLLLDASNVTPGATGTRAVVLRNVGDDPGTLRVSNLTLTEHENDRVGPEVDVDASPDRGELGATLRTSWRFRTPDQSTVALFGTGDRARPLSAVAVDGASRNVEIAPGETATLVVDWRVPAETGNVIQSDSLTLNATFQLRAS